MILLYRSHWYRADYSQPMAVVFSNLKYCPHSSVLSISSTVKIDWDKIYDVMELFLCSWFSLPLASSLALSHFITRLKGNFDIWLFLAFIISNNLWHTSLSIFSAASASQFRAKQRKEKKMFIYLFIHLVHAVWVIL